MSEGERWVPDFYDKALPRSKGFISDFIYYTRGFETPTLSCIWTALFVMASAIKREAWISWAPKPLYVNQYIIIIGPAGIVKKTTAVSSVGLPILRKFRNYLADRNVYAMKGVKVVKDKTTPEALLDSITPDKKEGHDFYLVDTNGEWLKGSDGKAVKYCRTSEVSLVVSELSTLLTKRSYSDSMTQILIDLYDCHDDWDWSTLSRGTITLKKLHTTMLAGTTVDGLRESIPRAAMGDGFLSRTIPVYVPDTRREYPRPFVPKLAPSEDELAKRLAWVVERTMGPYELDRKASDTFNDWYSKFKRGLRENPDVAGSLSRMDVNVYKTALLMKAQRYESEGNLIGEDDLLDAIRLLDLTYSSFSFLRSQVDPDELVATSSRVLQYLRRKTRKKGLTRGRLLSALHLKADMATLALEELVARGSVEVWYEGRQYGHATTRTGEEYRCRDDGDGGAEGRWEATGFNYTGETWDDTEDGPDAGGVAHGLEKVPEKGEAGAKARVEGGVPGADGVGKKGEGKAAGGRKVKDAPLAG